MTTPRPVMLVGFQNQGNLGLQARQACLEELLRERDSFVYSNQEIIIESLEQSGDITIIDDSEEVLSGQEGGNAPAPLTGGRCPFLTCSTSQTCPSLHQKNSS